jgi:hypothetical protein
MEARSYVWEYLRKNKLAITVFHDYSHIVDKSCEAWRLERSVWFWMANSRHRESPPEGSESQA